MQVTAGLASSPHFPWRQLEPWAALPAIFVLLRCRGDTSQGSPVGFCGQECPCRVTHSPPPCGFLSTLLCQRTGTRRSSCIIRHQPHTTRVSFFHNISPLALLQVLLLFPSWFLGYKKSSSHGSTLTSDFGPKLSSCHILAWVRGGSPGCCHCRSGVLPSLPGWHGSCSASARCGWRTSLAPGSGSAGSGASEQPRVQPLSPHGRCISGRLGRHELAGAVRHE